MDVLIVGAGPAGLACAHRAGAAREAELNIAVLEKAGSLGEHNLSGAVVNPRAFRDLFPDLGPSDFPFRQPVPGEAVYFLTEGRAQRIPTPPTMHNSGYYTASHLRDRAVARRAGRGAGRQPLRRLPGGLAARRGQRGARGAHHAVGPRAASASRAADFTEPTDLTGRVTVLAEGTRGHLGQAYREWQSIRSPNPQIFALGVKEVWETKKPLDVVIHTLGWPLPTDAFGGSFMYPMGPNRIALGIVVGLDYHDAGLDVHELLQRMKLHPLFRQYLEGGQLLEWGAKTIPEGGYHALAERFSGAGLLMVGDTAGFVDVPSLKGIHYAMHSGMLAARAAFAALKSGDTSAEGLAGYDRAVHESYIASDLHRTRNMRLAFKDGLYVGGVKAGLMTVTGGRFPGGKIDMPEDAATPRRVEEPAPFSRGRQAHVQQAGRGLQVGERDPGHDPVTSPRGSGHHRRGGGLLRPRLPGGRVRAGGGRAAGQSAELRGLQGDRRPGPALDAAGGGKRAEVSGHVETVGVAVHPDEVKGHLPGHAPSLRSG